MDSFVEQSVDKPLVMKKCRIPLLNKFAMMKLKFDGFSVSMIFLENTVHWNLAVACFVEPSLHSPALKV